MENEGSLNLTFERSWPQKANEVCWVNLLVQGKLSSLKLTAPWTLRWNEPEHEKCTKIVVSICWHRKSYRHGNWAFLEPYVQMILNYKVSNHALSRVYYKTVAWCFRQCVNRDRDKFNYKCFTRKKLDSLSKLKTIVSCIQWTVLSYLILFRPRGLLRTRTGPKASSWLRSIALLWGQKQKTQPHVWHWKPPLISRLVHFQ